MQYDAALEYRKARENLIKLYRLELAAWNAALPEPQPFRTYFEHGLILSGEFLGHVAIVSLDGQPYSEYRSLQVRPQRRDVYGMTADGCIEYVGELLGLPAWKEMERRDRDATNHRNHRRRP